MVTNDSQSLLEIPGNLTKNSLRAHRVQVFMSRFPYAKIGGGVNYKQRRSAPDLVTNGVSWGPSKNARKSLRVPLFLFPPKKISGVLGPY